MFTYQLGVGSTLIQVSTSKPHVLESKHVNETPQWPTLELLALSGNSYVGRGKREWLLVSRNLCEQIASMQFRDK